MVERINNNAYKLDLAGEYGVHATFNIADLSHFSADDELDLGTNCLQEEGSDEGLKLQIIKLFKFQVVRSQGLALGNLKSHYKHLFVQFKIELVIIKEPLKG